MSPLQIVAITVSLLVTVGSLALVARTVAGAVRLFKTGQPVLGRRDEPGRRTVTMLRETLGHTRMLTWGLQGAAHWFVMVAFGALFFTLVEAFGELFDPSFSLPLVGGAGWYGFLVELIALMCGLGIAALIVIRVRDLPTHATRKSRFTGSNMWMAYYVEGTIAAIIACVFLIRGTKVALEDTSYGAGHWISWFVGQPLTGLSTGSLEAVLWTVATVKILVSMAWFVTIALNARMGIAWHRFTAFPNIWFKRNASGAVSLGALQPMVSGGKPIDFEDPGEDDVFGVGQVEHFSWKGMLDFSTCTECGRCQSQCPAWNTGKPLSPKLLVMSLRDHQFAKAPYLLAGEDKSGVPAAAVAEAERPLIGDAAAGGVIDPDVLWSCTTCGACVQQCPVDIEHVDHILDMRRYQVLIESAFPSEAGVMLRNLENKGNPWGLNAAAREEWTEGLPFDVRRIEVGSKLPDDVDYLFWVGCAGALEDRSRKTTRAIAELLHTAGVSFAVLGAGESCTGDPARRLGNEYLFQTLGQQNVETLNSIGAKKIVAMCPHCFNTLANEYPQIGGSYDVVHHTQLLGTLVAEGRLVPVTPVDEKVTYHDPCYLGRHNRVYTPPRDILASVPGLRTEEMHRCKERGFCCGAGGARMWMEERIGKQINVDRIDEALSLDPDVVSTACPFCQVMLSDAVTAKKQAGLAREEVQVLDVSQLLARSLVAAGPATGSSAGPSAVDPGDTTEVGAEHPVAADPEATATADYPQLGAGSGRPAPPAEV